MSWLLILVVVALILAVAYGLYTRKGSGVSRHPLPGQQPPEHPDRDERIEQAGVDESEGDALDQRGTDTTA